MATLTDFVAAVVVHSSAVAFSHFGVTLDAAAVERSIPQAEQRVVARSPRKTAQKVSTKAPADCPDTRRAQVVRA